MGEPIITKCSAQIDDTPPHCTFNIGPIGSGNYVKMVHNGIEYGDMQLICEAYDILKHAGGLSNAELSSTFKEWNTGDLDSFLIEITGTIFETKDNLADGDIVDKILDKTGMKGTGRWTIQEAAERSCVGGVIAAALDARYVSGRKVEREAASKILSGPTEIPTVDKAQLIEDVKQALFAAKIVSYAQGFNMIQAASDFYEWNIDIGECARIFKGGCIIRSRFLDDITKAFKRDSKLGSLIVDPFFAEALITRQASWRRVVSLCVASGIPCPAFASALNYYDSYRRASLPANLCQAMRDFFGGHTYERIDREGKFHTEWTDAHKSIGDANERSKGEI